MAQYHASCHEVQSRGQEEIEHDLTGNTGIFSTCIACSSCISRARIPEVGSFPWRKQWEMGIVSRFLLYSARIAPYFALRDSLRDTGPLWFKNCATVAEMCQKLNKSCVGCLSQAASQVGHRTGYDSTKRTKSMSNHRVVVQTSPEDVEKFGQ